MLLCKAYLSPKNLCSSLTITKQHRFPHGFLKHVGMSTQMTPCGLREQQDTVIDGVREDTAVQVYGTFLQVHGKTFLFFS